MREKIFSLKMSDEIEVKTLEELRENFVAESVLGYFKSGELVDWLENLFYDDEAETVAKISKDDEYSLMKICNALGVEDLNFSQRISEKKKFLESKTDDQEIISNAKITALNQNDLAHLLHMDYKTIYLCGENFSVPLRLSDKKYIGVLSTPKIKIKATSEEELKTQNISFENCILPFFTEEQKIALAEKKYQEAVEFYSKVRNYDKAIKLFTQTIELNQNYKNAYHYRGLCYKALGQNAEAEADWKKYEELSKG